MPGIGDLFKEDKNAFFEKVIAGAQVDGKEISDKEQKETAAVQTSEQECKEIQVDFPQNEFFLAKGWPNELKAVEPGAGDVITHSFQCEGEKISFYQNLWAGESFKVACYAGESIEYSYVCNSIEDGVLAKIIDFSQKKCLVSSGQLSGCLVCEIVFPERFQSLFFHVGGDLEARKKNNKTVQAPSYSLNEKRRDLWNGILYMLPKVGIAIPQNIGHSSTTMSIQEFDKGINQLITTCHTLADATQMKVNLFYDRVTETTVRDDLDTKSFSNSYKVLSYDHVKEGTAMLLSAYSRGESFTYFMKQNVEEGQGYKMAYVEKSRAIDKKFYAKQKHAILEPSRTEQMDEREPLIKQEKRAKCVISEYDCRRLE